MKKTFEDWFISNKESILVGLWVILLLLHVFGFMNQLHGVTFDNERRIRNLINMVEREISEKETSNVYPLFGSTLYYQKENLDNLSSFNKLWYKHQCSIIVIFVLIIFANLFFKIKLVNILNIIFGIAYGLAAALVLIPNYWIVYKETIITLIIILSLWTEIHYWLRLSHKTKLEKK